MSAAKRQSKLSSRGRKLRYAGRKSLWLMLVAVVVGGLIIADRTGVFGRRPTPDAEKYDNKTFRVVKVIDGDTLDVDVPDRRYSHTRIRLWGVDTPEMNYDRQHSPPEHFAREATEFVRSRVRGREVRLELLPHRRTRGHYGRLLAYVHLDDDTMLNRELVRRGYAYADPRFRHKHMREFIRLQREAMRAGRGLWANVRQADLPDYWSDEIQLPATAPVVSE